MYLLFCFMIMYKIRMYICCGMYEMNVEFEGEVCIVFCIVRNVFEYFCSASDKVNLQRVLRWLKEREIIMEKVIYVVGCKEEMGY